MEYLFWIVLIGGFGFLMMRKGGCCGGGHSHGKNKSHDVTASSHDMAALNKKHSGSQ